MHEGKGDWIWEMVIGYPGVVRLLSFTVGYGYEYEWVWI